MLEQSVLSKKKRLNALKHTNQTQKRLLEELKMEYQRLKPEGSGGAQSTDASILKKEEDAMVLTTMVVFFLFVCFVFLVCTFTPSVNNVCLSETTGAGEQAGEDPV